MNAHLRTIAFPAKFCYTICMTHDNQDFTRGPVFSKLIAFMLPILLSLVLQSLYGAVDMLIVGRFGTTAGISGVAVGGNVMNLFTMLLNAITMGVTVLMGQYIGAKRFEQVNRLIGEYRRILPWCD